MDWCHESVMCVGVQCAITCGFVTKTFLWIQIEDFNDILGISSPYDDSLEKDIFHSRNTRQPRVQCDCLVLDHTNFVVFSQ